MHVYSIDEVFIDATPYLNTYGLTAHEFARKLIANVLHETGITATAGIGPNLYLCKVAMDIMAKHIPADRDGVRIAELDTQTYRQQFWSHPDIRAYRPENRSISSGQVLLEPYDFEHGRVIIREMAEKLSLELFSRRLVTDQLVLDVGYDIDNVKNPDLRAYLRGKVTLDRYGRKVPRPAHGSENLTAQTASTEEIIQAAVRLYDRIADRRLTIRRFNLSASHTVPESALAIKNRFGKNAVVRGTSFEEGATGRRRNEQIGGHQE